MAKACRTFRPARRTSCKTLLLYAYLSCAGFKARETGKYEVSSRKIAMKYVRSWFLLDLAASTPINLIFVIVAALTNGVSLKTYAAAVLSYCTGSHWCFTNSQTVTV